MEEKFSPGRWWNFANHHTAIPESLAPSFVKQFHKGTHSGKTALKTILAQHFMSPSFPTYVRGKVCVSKIIPIKGQESHPRCKMLEELRLQT
jgi:hypothetical protein